jgi:hypothetical protein
MAVAVGRGCCLCGALKWIAPSNIAAVGIQLGKMVYFTYKKLNICTVALLATVFAVLIAAMAVDWYSYKVEFSYTRVTALDSSLASSLYNYTQTTFDMFGQTVHVQVANTKIVGTSQQTYSQLGAASVNQQFKIQQAFVLIALLTAGILFVAHTLYFFDGFRNKILFFIGITALRTILIIALLIVVSAEIVAFLAFLGISDKIASDSPNCLSGPCQKFADTVTTQLGKSQLTISGVEHVEVSLQQIATWGPTAGWYLVLATIPLTVLATIIVVINRFPIPVDSLGTGEAL